jgi:tRNA pseudouridine32 synthase / 23S rRNA pseudouridine746 synthase
LVKVANKRVHGLVDLIMPADMTLNNDLAGHDTASAGFELVYADDSLLVVDKPPGLLAVPGRGEDKQDCLSSRVQALYPEALVVHRLDMATSGLMLLARSRAVQRALSMAFAAREVHKRYEAVVQGQLTMPPQLDNDWAVIDLPIALDWPARPLRVIDALLGKPSVTRWQVQRYDGDANTTRLLLEPVTGRSHQLRVHLKALGHPILGDALYAPAEIQMASPRLLLHSKELRLMHPVSGAPIQFEAETPF